jgi:hypothetical protein
MRCYVFFRIKCSERHIPELNKNDILLSDILSILLNDILSIDILSIDILSNNVLSNNILSNNILSNDILSNDILSNNKLPNRNFFENIRCRKYRYTYCGTDNLPNFKMSNAIV